MKSIKANPTGLVLALLLAATTGTGFSQDGVNDSFSGINLTATPVKVGVISLIGPDISEISSLPDAQLTAFVRVLDATPTIPAASLPRKGMAAAFWSLQNPKMPPLPGDTIGSAVWPLSDGNYLLNDVNFNYDAPVQTASSGTQMLAMAVSGPPIPGGGDGSTNTSDLANYQAQVFTTNDLWLEFTGQSNAVSSLVIHTPSSMVGSNFIYDIFATTNLLATVPGLNLTNWIWVTRTGPGQTNLTVAQLAGAPICFYRLGTLQDSDGDGLTDAYEKLVSHTNPNLWDSDGDGLGDGNEISPSGLPWSLEQVRHAFAVIYANAPVATQGGACGQYTVYLPSPAPAGGATIQYRLSGTAILNSDFTLSPAASQLVIPAGYSSGTISLCASSGSTYSPIKLYADITLTNATSCPVDGTPAEVNIVDTGSPGIRVYALPPWVRRPCATYGTNVAGFYFIRGGASSTALTVGFSTSGGTAVSGSDYTALPASISFAANVRTNWLPVSIIPNSTNTADKTLVLTINSAPGYQIDPVNGAATLTIAATASPVLPVVQVTATVPDATTATPGQFIFTRSFSTTSALRIYYHPWASVNNVISRTNNQDVTIYTALPGYVDIPANATSVTVPLVVNTPPTTVLPVVVTLAAGEYSIGTGNMDTVYIDGAGSFYVIPTETRNGVYGPNENDPVEITLTRYGSALSPLSVSWGNVTNSYIGFKITSASITGDVDTAPAPGGAGSHIFWAKHQSVAKINLSVNYTWNAPGNPNYDNWLTLGMTMNTGSGFVINPPTPTYTPQWNMVRLTSLTTPATVVANGNTVANALTISRPWTRSTPTAPQWGIPVGITLTGSAARGVDYTMNTVINIASNQTSVTVPIQALTATNLGWRTVVASVNSVYPGTQASPAGSDVAYARIQNPNNLVSDTDMDGDGLPDGYELNNLASGLDPTVPNNPYVDADRDGLGLLEELELGTDPNVADAPPVYPSIDDSDYSPLTLRLGAAGKMLTEPDQSCAVCHAVTLRAGNFIRTSPTTDWTHNPTTADFLIRFLRGTNYPIQVTCNPYYSCLLPSSATNTTYSPHYTAGYFAQFLLATNSGAYPFIVDPSQLLGTNLPMVQEVLPKTATLYIPDLTIAADVDRNGNIDFKNRNDRTATNNPFVFWINDDCDTNSDDTASDLNPSVNPPDSANNAIGNLRDLEDFARLQFKIDALPPQFLTNGNYQVKVYLTNLLGSPSLRLFPAADANGGIGYLTNTTTATAQIAKTMLGVVTNGTPLTIASSAWQTAGANSFFLPMIFEGISTGQCVINFGFSSNNAAPVALSRPFYLTLKRVTDLYEHWTVGDNTNTDWTQIPAYPTNTLDSGVYGAPQKPEDLDYIVFVHGWRMQPWERRAFASTAYKRMWQLGYKGRFGLYSWPTDYSGLTFWDFRDLSTWQNYDRSEQRAWKSGVGLVSLLADLNETEPPNKIRVLAHSMGNIVASEMLRLANVMGVELPLVQGYIASQAASVAHAYDATNPAHVFLSFAYRTPEIYAQFQRGTNLQPYFTGIKKAVQGTNIFNFNNVQDFALNTWYAWPLNQASKPDSGWYCQFVATNRVNTNNWYTFWRGTNQLILNGKEQYHDQTYEIFAHIAQAESAALGCAEDNTHHIRGEIGGVVNLNNAPFGYQANTYEHSAEFNSINMNRRSYWWQVLSTFALTNNLPQP